ncbi:MAG: aminoacetone oxidase family FAD-binding enzyme [Candidatus Omnitrophica bacterium]|nr:aminoacetone oxidase family FAD-binding enzyme [Candidatus Omnitrophota bacterium]
MNIYDIAIIGAGPAGITASINAASLKKNVILLEKQNSIGRKISVCGAGRCNFLNENLNESFYNLSAQKLVKSVFGQFGKKEILGFFDELGLKYYSEDRRFFPITNQSASVLKVLEIRLRKSAVKTELNFEVSDMAKDEDIFLIKSKDLQKISAKKVIFAAGGKAYPALGSSTSLYGIAEKFGHGVITPVPAAVPLTAKDQFCHFLQGQKIFAKVKCVIEGKPVSEAAGEVLFTKYGLSGTAILDVSEQASIAINRHNKKVKIELDAVPFMEEEALKLELAERIKKGFEGEDLIAGILPNKFTTVLKDYIFEKNVKALSYMLKHKFFDVQGTRGWNEAEFTAGGINTNEINEKTLESKLVKGLYVAGEILDVTGVRGGYNLAFASASGFISAKHAANT